MIENKTLKYKLLKGKDIEFEEGMKLKNCTLDYIFEEISIEIYEQLIHYSNMRNELDDELRLYMDITFLTTFIDYGVPTFSVGFHNDFNEFMIKLEDEEGNIEIKRLKYEKLDDVITLFKKMYCVSKPIKQGIDESLAGNEQTAESIRRINDVQKTYGKKSKYGMTFYSMIESVASCSNGYTFFNVWDLTVYQLNKIIERIDRDKNFEHIMSGLYSGMGTVDPKKTDISKEYWSNDTDV